jgi:hypothetical protein
MPDEYDRRMGMLDGLPDVVRTRPRTLRVTTPLLGNVQTWIVQSWRQAEVGDTVFLERVGRDGALRLVIPPKVANAIAAQREALTDKNRSRAAREKAQERKLAGIVPFQRKEAE